ncbi:uncharacterized protein L203_106258 [Cryptococcus depauperatus CBS 7841]|uniref:TATA-binding protein interacting (TIP20) domain-containing protein n=1 Tax=Cryptococcus depauperatus CBS 7841 TaxID=1295531 RepID=A0AAJ8JYV3_9TREE
MSTIPLSSQLPSLQQKMRSIDPDYRIMALVDLNKDLTKILNPPSSVRRLEPNYTDEYTENELVEDVVRLLADSNGEVKSAAVSCISLMVKKPRPQSLTKIIQCLLNDISSTDDEKRDTSCLALKNVVLEMPADAKQVTKDIETIVTRLFTLFDDQVHPQIASELLQILTDLFNRFPSIIASSASIQSTAISSLSAILSGARTNIQNRAIPTLSSLIASNPSLLDIKLQNEILNGIKKSCENARVWMGVITSLARGRNVASIGSLIVNNGLAESIIDQACNPEDALTTEAALTALEAIVLRCPKEISPHILRISQQALELVKYDPNYVELGDDDDVDMGSEDGIDDDEYGDADYSDEDDDSWKVRRSSAKLLLALISTRPDFLSDFYRMGALLLITRFSEREESVRLEVLAAFGALLRQTISVRAAAEIASGARNKRKRSEGIMDEDYTSDDGPIIALRQYLPQLTKSTLTQISSKSVATRQQSFVLFRQVVTALSGGLEESVDPICIAAASALRTVDSATSSSLAIATLSFLSKFFLNHSARTYATHLKELVPAIVRCMKAKFQRITLEAFETASALAQSIRSVRFASTPMPDELVGPIQQIFVTTISILGDNSMDGDVREKALATLGNIFVNAGDLFVSSFSTSLPLITNRLLVQSSAFTSIYVIGQLASSSLCSGPEFESWLLEVLPQVVVAFRRTKRSASSNSEFVTLSSIINRIGENLPVDIAENLVVELSPIAQTPTALQTAALILTYQPAVQPAIESRLYPMILNAVKASLGSLVHPFATFFGAYASALHSTQDVITLVQDLIGSLESVNKAVLPDITNGGTGAWVTISKCVGGIARCTGKAAGDILAIFENIMQTNHANVVDVYLALLCIGEIGCIIDLSSNSLLFDTILEYFKSDSEQIGSAAAFAAGSLAVGSPEVFLPVIIKRIENPRNESDRLLFLHSIKEVILHSPITQLETLANSVWDPLFASTRASTDIDDTGDDGIRNVTAACIGKLTIAAPNKCLPQLQELLHGSPFDRALVIAAIRYTFTDTSSGYDELITPIIVDFLSLMQDKNLIVRRLSLASLNAAIQNKPHLIIDKLGFLQPLLYQETYVRKELQREVAMGPWKVIEDDGLENRKTAYETMYTLLGTCFIKIDLPVFTARVLDSLSDVNEVKVLGLMLLLRLGQLSPESVIPRLEEVVDNLKAIMKDVEVKDDTIKQDLERKAEMQRSTLRAIVPLYKSSSPQQAPAFHQFVESLLATEKWKEFRDYQA